jgi:hypothetical protein
MLIRGQNWYAPRSRRYTGRREAQSRDPVKKFKNLPEYQRSPHEPNMDSHNKHWRQWSFLHAQGLKL